MNKLILPVIFLSTGAFAQSQSQQPVDYQGGYNAINNFEKPNAGVNVGVNYGEFKRGANVPFFNFQFKAENLNGDFLGAPAQANVALGYSPEGYLRLQYTFSPNKSENKKSRPFFIVPLLGDMRMIPGHSQLGYTWSDNTTMASTYGGVGYKTSGRFQDGKSTFRASAAAKYVIFDEMLPPDQYSDVGAHQNHRSSVNMIEGQGWGSDLQAQVSFMNKFLLGIGEESSILRDQGTTVTYYNHEGKVFARMHVTQSQKLMLDLDANYYVRITDMTDLRTQQVLNFVGVSAHVGFKK